MVRRCSTSLWPRTIKVASIAERKPNAGMRPYAAPFPSPPVLCVHPKQHCPSGSDNLSSVCNSHERGALKLVGEGDQHCSPDSPESDVIDTSMPENGSAKAQRSPPPTPEAARVAPSDKPEDSCGTSSSSHDTIPPHAMNADSSTQKRCGHRRLIVGISTDSRASAINLHPKSMRRRLASRQRLLQNSGNSIAKHGRC